MFGLRSIVVLALCLASESGCGRARLATLPPAPQAATQLKPALVPPADRTLPSAGRVVLETWPTPVDAIPSDLAWLIVSFNPAVPREDVLYLGLVDAAVLQSTPLDPSSFATPRFILAAPGDPVTSAILYGTFVDEECSTGERPSLCPGKRYRLQDSRGAISLAEPVTFVVAEPPTSRAEWFGAPSLSVADTAVALRRQTTAPCRLHDRLQPEVGAGPVALADISNGEALITNLSPDTDYQWELVCIDASGRASSPWTVSFHTLPQQQLQLSELNLDPMRDWNDSTGAAGLPFDLVPGPEPTATPSDQYVELVNSGSSVVDASAWRVMFSARTDKLVSIAEAFARGHVYTSSQGLTLSPGQYLVLRASSGLGSVAKSSRVALLDPLGQRKDHVQMEAPRPEQQLPFESLTRCADDWRWAEASPAAANPCGL